MKLFYSNIFWKEFGKNLNTPLKHYFAERMTQIKWCLRWSLKVSLFFEWVGHGWYIFSHGSFCTIFYVYLSKLSSQILNLHCVIFKQIYVKLQHCLIQKLPSKKIIDLFKISTSHQWKSILHCQGFGPKLFLGPKA